LPAQCIEGPGAIREDDNVACADAFRGHQPLQHRGERRGARYSAGSYKGALLESDVPDIFGQHSA